MKIEHYIQAIRRGWWVISLTALTALVIALLLSYIATPVYRSKARLVVIPGPGLLAGQEQGVINSLIALDRRSIAATYAEILSSERMFEETEDKLQINAEEYTRKAVVLPEANVLELSIEGPDPEIAALLANEVSEHAIDYIRNLYLIFDISILDSADAQSELISPKPLRDATVAFVIGLILGAGLVVLREELQFSLSNRLKYAEITHE